MKVESNVPEKIEKKHIGMKVLYRLPNQVVISEGVIDGLSPEERFVCINKTRWVENGSGAIVAVLSKSKCRREAIK